MPEGPEIKIAADKLARVLEGQRIIRVEFGLTALEKFNAVLSGYTISAIETRGKALLTHFEHGLSIYSHNQLYGQWRIVKGQSIPLSNRSQRILLQTASHTAILYSASDISVWPTNELAMHPFLAKVGPDILQHDIQWRDVYARLNDIRFKRRQLSALYLDQHFLAGNGNYLRSEILFEAGLFAKQKPMDLSRAELGKLARATLMISRRSYDTAGITLAPRLVKHLTKHSPNSRHRFYVFSRAGQACHVCGTTIERIEMNGRRLYFCPTCQPS